MQPDLVSTPRRVRTSTFSEQSILILYDPSVELTVTTLYNNIHKQYAFFFVVPRGDEQLIKKYRKNMALSKRRIKFVYVEPREGGEYQGIRYTQVLYYCSSREEQAVNKLEEQFPGVETIVLDSKDDPKKLFLTTTKKLHLDFIWLGVSGRLGTSVAEFVACVKQFENFMEIEDKEETNYINRFLKVLDRDLEAATGSTQQDQNSGTKSFESVLSGVAGKIDKNLQEVISQLIKDEIIYRFNERIILSQLSYHKHYKLLKTRNYFKSIWIQQSSIKRYRNFNHKIENEPELAHLHSYMASGIENFLLLDDYLYEHFQQRVAHSADYIINTGLDSRGYRAMIETNYKQIFRKFRPDFDEYFISICQILKTRSGCIKQAVGSIIVKEKRILSTGYNGTPMGAINCYNGGCTVCNNSESINTQVLSQYSCIIEAGIESTPGCTLYTTQLPCLWCAKVISQAKISTVVYVGTDCWGLAYDNQERVFELFDKAGIECREFSWGESRFSKPA